MVESEMAIGMDPEKPIHKPKAAIFDMDGVLCETSELHYKSWEKALSRFGIDFSRDINAKLGGLTRSRSLEVILGDNQISDARKEQILNLKNLYYLDSVNQLGPGDLLPGIGHLLAGFREDQVLLGVASASQNVSVILRQLEIDYWIDTAVDGRQVHQSKPSPDPFLAAAAQLGVEPIQCLVFEDSEAGVISGKSAGMCVIGLGRQAAFTDPAFCFDSLENIEPEYLYQCYSAWLEGRLSG